MKRLLTQTTVVMATGLGVVGMAFGQAEPPAPPPIQDMGSPMLIVYYLIGFVGLAICVTLAAFPGRRAFED